MRALVDTADGLFAIDAETGELLALEPGEEFSSSDPVPLDLPRVLTAAASGSTVVAVVDRRPPLLVSHDSGTTWHEAGGGLPPGRAVAIAEDDPDRVLYAARNRLYVSTDGARFWRALAEELPEIRAVAWA
jgi:hypothetical protein